MTTITSLYCKKHFLTFLTEDEGQWIQSINTKTNKGFGVYQCECSKIWSYAKSRSNFTRNCKNKKCNKPNYPVFIWNHFITIAYCREMIFTFLTEEQGQWIPNINIENTTSFGVYQCECGKIWSSARSRCNFRQGCKNCGLGCFPMFIWKNNTKSYSKTTPISTSIKPHEISSCEYCQLYGEERCKKDSSSSIRTKVKPIINQEVKPVVKPIINQEVNQVVKPVVKPIINQEVNQEVKQVVKPVVKPLEKLNDLEDKRVSDNDGLIDIESLLWDTYIKSTEINQEVKPVIKHKDCCIS